MKTRYLLGIISLIAILVVGCGSRQLVENNKEFNNKIKEATSGRVELKELLILNGIRHIRFDHICQKKKSLK